MEQVRKERRHGQSEGKRGGGRELRREGATDRGRGARDGRKLQGRYPEEDTDQYMQYTAHKTAHNTARAIATLVLQKQNCKRIYKLCIAMRRNVLFDRWMT